MLQCQTRDAHFSIRNAASTDFTFMTGNVYIHSCHEPQRLTSQSKALPFSVARQKFHKTLKQGLLTKVMMSLVMALAAVLETPLYPLYPLEVGPPIVISTFLLEWSPFLHFTHSGQFFTEVQQPTNAGLERTLKKP